MTTPLPPGHTRQYVPLLQTVSPAGISVKRLCEHAGMIGVDVPGIGLTCGCPPEPWLHVGDASSGSATFTLSEEASDALRFVMLGETPIAAPETSAEGVQGDDGGNSPEGPVALVSDALTAIQGLVERQEAELRRQGRELGHWQQAHAEVRGMLEESRDRTARLVESADVSMAEVIAERDDANRILRSRGRQLERARTRVDQLSNQLAEQKEITERHWRALLGSQEALAELTMTNRDNADLILERDMLKRERDEIRAHAADLDISRVQEANRADQLAAELLALREKSFTTVVNNHIGEMPLPRTTLQIGNVTIHIEESQ